MNHAITFDVTILPNLKFRSQNSYYNLRPTDIPLLSEHTPRKVEGEGGEAYRADWSEYTPSSENTLTFNLNTKSGHNPTDGEVSPDIPTTVTTSPLEGKGYMDDNVKWNNMNAVPDKETYSAATSTTKKTKMSALARFNYNYKQRYYVTFTGRYDGASNFAANNKWAFFPSGALSGTPPTRRFSRVSTGSTNFLYV